MQDLHRMPFRIALMLAAGLITAACATTPPPAPLSQARNAYNYLAADPEVAKHAPVELDEAEKAVERAEAGWNRDTDEVETNHLAYIADKRIAIARAVAQQALAEAEASRIQVLLDAREAAREQEVAALKQVEIEELKHEEIAAQEPEETDGLKQREVDALKALKAEQTNRGAVITLGDVLFELGGNDLKPDAIQTLMQLAAFLHEYPERTVAIEGHTDSVGPKAFNVTLSRRRAQSVQNILVHGGIDPSRISAEGYGEAHPVASNSSKAGRQRNRRVELVVQSSNGQAKASP